MTPPDFVSRIGDLVSVSNRLIAGGIDPSGWRLPAEALETCLRQVVVRHLRQSAEGHAILARPDASSTADLSRRAMALADQIDADTGLFGKFVETGTLSQGRVDLRLDASALATALQVSIDALSSDLTQITEPFTLRRRGVETKIIAGETVPAPDPVLQRSLAEARGWAKDLRAGKSLIEIARQTGRSEPYVRNRIPLAFLSPRLQAAILDGRQPADFSVAKLVRDGFPADWNEQARMFGIG